LHQAKRLKSINGNQIKVAGCVQARYSKINSIDEKRLVVECHGRLYLKRRKKALDKKKKKKRGSTERVFLGRSGG